MVIQFKNNFYRSISFYIDLILAGLCIYSYRGDRSVGEYIIDSIFLLSFIISLFFDLFSVHRK